MSLTMPPHTAGHDLQSMTGCAFFAYADLNEAATMPGASVLGGWPAPPWGQIAMGPAPPSLHSVKVCMCLIHFSIFCTSPSVSSYPYTRLSKTDVGSGR